MPRSRTSSAVELLVRLRRDDPAPLHHQLEHELRAAVRSGGLAPGVPPPPTRALAAQLGLSRGVVVEVKEQLVAEGSLPSRDRSATRVARDAALPPPAHQHDTPPAEPRVDFHPGRPDVAQFPRAAWMRSMRRVLNEAPSQRFSYAEGRGLLELRLALAAYLNRVRGTAADAGRIVISNGFSQGLALVAEVMRASGARRVAIEDPSHYGARATLQASGLEPVGVPVDRDGLRVDLLAQMRIDAVLVTPAHQYPTGGVLPPERRAALVEWATRASALVIEDDYDAEYRYDREPIGAIQGLAPDRVIYGGVAGKKLAPPRRAGGGGG